MEKRLGLQITTWVLNSPLLNHRFDGNLSCVALVMTRIGDPFKFTARLGCCLYFGQGERAASNHEGSHSWRSEFIMVQIVSNQIRVLSHYLQKSSYLESYKEFMHYPDVVVVVPGNGTGSTAHWAGHYLTGVAVSCLHYSCASMPSDRGLLLLRHHEAAGVHFSFESSYLHTSASLYLTLFVGILAVSSRLPFFVRRPI